jgi:Na+-transporting NADH:ubiquinone oxidoreductase subunit F
MKMFSVDAQALLGGIAVFTFSILLLAGFVLGVKKTLTPQGSATVLINGQRQLSGALGTSLLNLLADYDIYLPIACGGRGACGQCRIMVTGGAPPLTAVEASHIRTHEARQGQRLACLLTLHRDLEIQLPEKLLGARCWRCVVFSSRNVTTFMKEIILKLPAEKHIDFSAGSFVLVEAPPHRLNFSAFDIEAAYRSEWAQYHLFDLESEVEHSTTRAYSMVNPPLENDRIVLTVRIALPPPNRAPDTPPGVVSSWLFGLKPGDTVSVSGPFGEFCATESSREMVMIGGGAGIAPLFSIIRDQLERCCSERKISLWYGARNEHELCYAAEFDALAQAHDNFRWQAALSDPNPGAGWCGPTGFIHAVVLERYLKDHPAPFDLEYYICGPPLMNMAALEMLEDLGVDPADIYLDDFGVQTS